jgi:hypothetical protein
MLQIRKGHELRGDLDNNPGPRLDEIIEARISA